MGTLVGHVAPGLGFLLIGLWHLFNHTKLHVLDPGTYATRPWFPAPVLRHLELLLIMAGSAASVAMELFIGPERHQPLDPADWTIPAAHLHNFEHSLIAFTFFTYAAFSIGIDRCSLASPAVRDELTYLFGAAAFAQQLLLFHLHAADHSGVEGQYHLLLQTLVLASLASTLLGISCPGSFAAGFVRSFSVMFQGVWLVVMGLVLWTPALVPKGCFMNEEEGHTVVRCTGDGALSRAKSLVNIQFGWFFVSLMIFAMGLYLILLRRYAKKVKEVIRYSSLNGEAGEEEDLESPWKRLEGSGTQVPLSAKARDRKP